MKYFLIIPAVFFAACIFILAPLAFILDGCSDYKSIKDLVNLISFSKIIEWLALIPWAIFLILFILQSKIRQLELMRVAFYISLILSIPFFLKFSELTELAAICFVFIVVVAPLWFFTFMRPYDENG